MKKTHAFIMRPNESLHYLCFFTGWLWVAWVVLCFTLLVITSYFCGWVLALDFSWYSIHYFLHVYDICSNYWLFYITIDALPINRLGEAMARHQFYRFLQPLISCNTKFSSWHFLTSDNCKLLSCFLSRDGAQYIIHQEIMAIRFCLDHSKRV